MNETARTEQAKAMRGAAFATFLGLGILATGNGAWVAAFQDEWPMVALVSSSLVWFTIGFVVLAVVHEAIHGLTMSFLNRRRPDFKVQYGVAWSALMPYAHPIGLIPATAYRMGVLAPGLLLGILPLVYAVAARDVYIAGWAILNTAGAAGDFLLLAQLRGVPGQVLVEDLEDAIGVKVHWDLVSAASKQHT